MAQFLVRNALNPNKVVKIGISFSKAVSRPEMTGDSVWVVELGTVELHKNGGSIAPIYLNLVSLENISEEITKATTSIAEQIDWGNLLEDSRPPYIYSTNVVTSTMDINSSVFIDLREFFPSSGIDKSSIKLEVNNIDVTNELFFEGNPYRYLISWYPRQRVRSVFY